MLTYNFRKHHGINLTKEEKDISINKFDIEERN